MPIYSERFSCKTTNEGLCFLTNSHHSHAPTTPTPLNSWVESLRRRRCVIWNYRRHSTVRWRRLSPTVESRHHTRCGQKVGPTVRLIVVF